MVLEANVVRVVIFTVLEIQNIKVISYYNNRVVLKTKQSNVFERNRILVYLSGSTLERLSLFI